MSLVPQRPLPASPAALLGPGREASFAGSTRSRWTVALCALGVLLASPAVATPPELVRHALDQAASPTLSSDARLSRVTVALTALDALPPTEALATLTALTRSPDPRVARRAALERARLLGSPSPDVVATFEVCALSPGAETHTGLDKLSKPSASLIATHRAAQALPSCAPIREPHLLVSDDALHHLRIPVAGASKAYLATEGDVLVSVQTDHDHHWLGYTLGLRAGRGGLEPGRAPEQLTLHLPKGATHLFLTIASPEPTARIALTLDAALADDDHAPAPVQTGREITGPLRPLSSLPDDDLWGHAARRLLGLPDQGRSLEERLGLEHEIRTERPLNPRTADLILALPAIPRLDQRASLVGISLARAPDPLLELTAAHLALDRGQVQRARTILDTLGSASRAARAPDTRRLAARIARYEGRPEDAIVVYDLTLDDALAKTQSLSTLERLELAQAATELGQADLSAALRRELAAHFPGRLDLGTASLAALVAAGDVDQALALADALADRHPTRPLIALDAAERHLAHATDASRERASNLVRRALPLLSRREDADAVVRAGLVLEALNEPRAAREALTRALVLSPGHPAARRHLERLDSLPGVAKNPLSLDALALADTAVVDPDAPFEILGEEIVVKVAADGTTTRWVRRVLRAQRVPDKRELRTHRIRFDPSRENVTVLSAHIHHMGPRPRRESVIERHVHSLTEDWYGLYYDLRQLSIPFDRLDRDDLIEITWRVDPVGQLFPGVVDLFEVLSERIPKHLIRLTVEYPASLALSHRLSEPPGTGHYTVTTSTEAGLTRLVLEGKDLPPLPIEPHAPGTAEVAPVWQVTSFASWDELARWYLRLIEPAKVQTPAMRELVQSLSAGRTKDETIRAITTWVTQQIRYVGLEFGIHGYRPYRTDEVFARRFGDCKDKSTLLATLLSMAGVDASVVLVRTRKQGRLDGALPSLALFDHVVAWLPSRFQFVDPTAIYYGLGELPREDQGAQILTLAPDAALARSPIDPPARNGIVGRYAFTIDRLGRGGLSAQVSMLGVQAPLYRSALLEPATRSKRLEEVLNRRYPGLSLSSLDLTDPADHHRPVDLAFTADIPRLASRAEATAEHGMGLQIPRPAGVDGQLERLAPEKTRHLPLVIGPPTRWDLRFRYVFPEGYRATRLPPGGEAVSPFGRYRVRWSADGQAIDVETELELAVDQVSPADYPALRAFLEAFDRAVAPALVAAPPLSEAR